MRFLAILGIVFLTSAGVQAKRVKTPRSENARAFGETHKSHGKHDGQKVKVRKKRERYN